MLIDEIDLYNNIGQRVRNQRKIVKMTQDQLAAKIGVTRTSITNIEAGTQKLSIYLLYSIAIALELEITAILPLISEVEGELPETVQVEGYTGKMSPSAAEFVREAVKDLSNNDES